MKVTAISQAIFLMLFPGDLPNGYLFSSWRPCCSVAQDFYTQNFNYTKTVSLAELGTHQLGNQKNAGVTENNGLIYTCRYGLIDTAHVRDAADWTKEAFKYVQSNIGTGLKNRVKSDGTKRMLLLKKTPVADLNQEDLLKISARIVYENTIWHEIASGLDLVEFQWMSSFSPEDIFSDLLGIRLAVKALKNGGDFDTEFTKLFYNFVSDAEPMSKSQTQSFLDRQDGILWKKGLFFSELNIRNFSVYGEVQSYQAVSEPTCIQGRSPQKLPALESSLSNQKAVSDYFEYIINLNEKMDLIFIKYGVRPVADDITEKDFPKIIPIVEQYVQRKNDFFEDVPIEIHGCDKFNYYKNPTCLKHIVELFFSEKFLR